MPAGLYRADYMHVRCRRASKSKIKRVSSLAVRYSTHYFDGQVKLSYDEVTDVASVDVPFYFIQASEGPRETSAFNAGRKFGWSSDKRKGELGIFVGSLFEFFGP